MATLQNYNDDTLRLLRDANLTYYSQADINSFINRAMQQRDRDSLMNRQLTTFPLVVGQSAYQLTSVNPNAFDVVGIALLYSNIRVELDNPSYRDLSMTMLSVVNYNDVPRAFSKYGVSTIYIGPPPNSPYSTEWDCLVTSPTLVNTTDLDPLLFPWTDPVPFLAASFAKLELGEFEEAERFEKLYMQRMTALLGSTRGMTVVDPYFTSGRGDRSGRR